MIKKMIKKIIPKKVLNIIKIGREIVYFKKLIKKLQTSKQDRIYIIGTPIHTNLGDHLITKSEISFLNDYYGPEEIIEIPSEVYIVFKNRLEKYITKASKIYINGGGWLGNVWVDEELLMQEIIRSFPDNKIVIFPQTIYYDEFISPYQELIESSQNTYRYCRDITLCVRECNSYEFAKKEFPGVNTLLAPDIALYYLKYAPKNSGSKTQVGYCLRKDREVVDHSHYFSIIKKELLKYNFSEVEISTMASKRVSTLERDKYLEKKFLEFTSCSLIVTDRLHGMIFAFITNTPCIILDNKTQKVSGVYNKWLNKSKLICPVFCNEDLKNISEFIANIELHSRDELSLLESFEELKELIK